MGSISTAAAPEPPPRRIHLVEERVFVQLDPRVNPDPQCWVLDTGAANHMTGGRGVFSELDTGITGTVRFGDGSVVEIEGRGTIVFICRNGEHRALTGVYLIPRLTTGIIRST